MKNVNKNFLWTLLILGVVGYVWWTWPTGWPIKNNPPTSPVIVVFGDSLAEGGGSTDPKTYGPAARLEARWGRPVINMGHPGIRTDQGLGLLGQVEAAHPGLVIVSLGGNDYLQRRKTEEIFTNLRSVVTQLQEMGAAVCVIGLEPELSIAYSYAKDFKKLCQETGAVLVPDALNGITSSPKLRADAYHPNNDGYEIFTDRIGAALDEIVAQMPSPK